MNAKCELVTSRRSMGLGGKCSVHYFGYCCWCMVSGASDSRTLCVYLMGFVETHERADDNYYCSVNVFRVVTIYPRKCHIINSP